MGLWDAQNLLWGYEKHFRVGVANGPGFAPSGENVEFAFRSISAAFIEGLNSGEKPTFPVPFHPTGVETNCEESTSAQLRAVVCEGLVIKNATQ